MTTGAGESMAGAAADADAAEAAIRPTPGQTVLLLGVTQLLGYGTLYYSFAMLAPDIGRDLGLSVPTLFGLFSLALLASGFLAPLVGRAIDRRGARMVMAAGSLAAAAALGLMAAAPGPALFAVGLLGTQLAGTAVLYEAAFACLVQSSPAQGRRLITLLTLIAGFSSTLFWPLVGLMQQHLGWREILGIYAAANFAICVPLHLLLPLRRRLAVLASPSAGEDDGARDGLGNNPLPPEMHRRAFLLVATGFALGGFLFSAMLAQLVPVLASLGLGSTAVMVSSLFGPAQVLVRLGSMVAGRRHPITATLFCIGLFPLGALILTASAPAVSGAVVFAVILGFGSGLKSIVQGTLPLAVFGRQGYGERLGKLSSVRLVITAAAPFVLSWLMETIGPRPALLVLAAVGLLGLGCFVLLARMVAAARG